MMPAERPVERRSRGRPSRSAPGVAVSPLQMATVYATIANGGTYVQPSLVRATVGTDGVATPVPAAPHHRVVSAATSEQLTEMLAYAVQDGTGYAAQIAGYQVAGKTGTAKKVDSAGKYIDRYVASFIGFLPASQPKVVIAAILDEPDTVYGGVAAAPLFQHVARYAIQRLGIEPSAPVALPPHRAGRSLSRHPGRVGSRAVDPTFPQVRLADVAATVGAEVRGDPDAIVRDASYDSRDVPPGSLFFCIPGDVVDGHAFAQQAVDAAGERPGGRSPPRGRGAAARRPLGPRGDRSDGRRGLRAPRPRDSPSSASPGRTARRRSPSCWRRCSEPPGGGPA